LVEPCRDRARLHLAAPHLLQDHGADQDPPPCLGLAIPVGRDGSLARIDALLAQLQLLQAGLQRCNLIVEFRHGPSV